MKKLFGVLIALCIIGGAIIVVVVLNEQQSLEQFPEMEIETSNSMKIESSAFQSNGSIPSRYTCDGEGVNPPLALSGVPSNTQSLVLIVDDPDASQGTFDHWVAWNFSPVIAEITEGATMEGDAIIGKNSANGNAYFPPCPPSGEHRYFFKLYALDVGLDLPVSSTKVDVERAMEGHMLDSAELIGRYKRTKE
mgnify:CR=1 FL=1